jgi:hypothetical protein
MSYEWIIIGQIRECLTTGENEKSGSRRPKLIWEDSEDEEIRRLGVRNWKSLE